MKKPIQFNEYERKTWTDLSKEGLTQVHLPKLKSINRLAKKSILQIDPYQVRATSNVGVFSINGKCIQILPKFCKNDDQTLIVRNLLYMLNYTKKLRVSEAEITDLTEREESNLLEILIHLFAKNLIEVLKSGFYRDYVTIEDRLIYLKGRINFSGNIRGNPSQRHKLLCNYSEFTENILINQIFKYTVFLLSRLTSSEHNKNALRQLSFMLSDIELKTITNWDFKKVHLNRLNRRMEPLLQLARIFITDGSIELHNDKLETYSLIFDMEILFEEFVAELIKQNKSLYFTEGTNIITQKSKKTLVDAPRPLFALKPDIIIQNATSLIILDTKYKELDPEDSKEGVSQSDMYQMLAYAIKYGSSDCILIYPSHLNFVPGNLPHIIKVENRLVKVHIKTIPLDIDMIREKKRLFESFNFLSEMIHNFDTR